MLHSFEYAVLRIVPCLERGEFINAGLILSCLSRGFLDARVHLDVDRVLALRSDMDIEVVRAHLEAFPKICAGGSTAGPIAKLSKRERFHWLVAPRSTVIQVSPVHAGLCDSPEERLNELFKRLVL